MQIAVITETGDHETRVAATPETVKKLIGLGASVRIEAGAGLASGITDSEYEAAGAVLAKGAKDTLQSADVVLKVRRPSSSEIKLMPTGALVLAIMDPYDQTEALKAMAEAGLSTFAMELMPRITRAQVMDVLSSQANLAGYQAVEGYSGLRKAVTLERQAVSSNGEAAKIAAADPTIAAIAGDIAQQQYGLSPVQSSIQDDPHNRTRFVVISHGSCQSSGKDQTSVILSVTNKPGAVYHLLAPLAKHGVSMNRFESRPARRGTWEYFFYIDMDGHASEPKVAAALAELETEAAFFKNLGSYPRSH